MPQSAGKKRFHLKAPNLLVLIFLMILLASLLTYVVPAGQFDLDESGSLITGTYHAVAQSPVNPWQAVCRIFDGLVANAWVISIVLLMGGAIGAILSTGAVEELMGFAAYRLKDKGLYVLIPICMYLMSFLSALGGSDAFVAFVAVGIVFARKLRLDPIAAVAIFFMSSFVGFFSGPFCMTAQIIARVTPLSGFVLRLVWLLVSSTICVLYTVRYCARVAKDPAKSLMGDAGWLAECDQPSDALQAVPFRPRSAVVVVLLFGTFIFVTVGIMTIGWGYAQFAAAMMLLLIVCGIIYRMGPNAIADAFAKGVMSMSFVAVVIGMAKAISLVLEDGNILHTLINGVTTPLSSVPQGVATVLMFLSNLIINIFIPSGTGQAAVVLPLMCPIGDLLGIPRQVVVSAFVYGDGLTNLCIPTFGALMGALGMAKVPFGRWLRFVFPFILLMFAINSVLLFVLTAIGWTGM